MKVRLASFLRVSGNNLNGPADGDRHGPSDVACYRRFSCSRRTASPDRPERRENPCGRLLRGHPMDCAAQAGRAMALRSFCCTKEGLLRCCGHDPRPALAALPDRIGDLVAPITGMEEAAE
jgi:hypothetical protein